MSPTGQAWESSTTLVMCGKPKRGSAVGSQSPPGARADAASTCAGLAARRQARCAGRNAARIPTTQPTSGPTNQTTNQPINQPTNQPARGEEEETEADDERTRETAWRVHRRGSEAPSSRRCGGGSRRARDASLERHVGTRVVAALWGAREGTRVAGRESSRVHRGSFWKERTEPRNDHRGAVARAPVRVAEPDGDEVEPERRERSPRARELGLRLVAACEEDRERRAVALRVVGVGVGGV